MNIVVYHGFYVNLRYTKRMDFDHKLKYQTRNSNLKKNKKKNKQKEIVTLFCISQTVCSGTALSRGGPLNVKLLVCMLGHCTQA